MCLVIYVCLGHSLGNIGGSWATEGSGSPFVVTDGPCMSVKDLKRSGSKN